VLPSQVGAFRCSAPCPWRILNSLRQKEPILTAFEHGHLSSRSATSCPGVYGILRDIERPGTASRSRRSSDVASLPREGITSE
jgi:hypothetical protein